MPVQAKRKTVSQVSRVAEIEKLLKAQKYDEALALTFEVLPDRQKESAVGIDRQSRTPDLSEIQRLGLYLLRAQAYIGLRHWDKSARAQQKAEYLLNSYQSELKEAQRDRYEASLAALKAETLFAKCKNECAPPKKISEKEFLNYADRFYQCLEPSKMLICTLQSKAAKDIYEKEKTAYDETILIPLSLKNPLPPPARKLKNLSQKKFYEEDMKLLIQRTVDEKIKPFNDLTACEKR
ncbi:MAG: hypothetical protein AB7F43_05595 [Bacteriovoracia bacterium]